MSKLIRKLLAYSIGMCSIFSIVAAAIANDAPERNVIYVVLDGMRWQEIFGGAQEEFVSKLNGVREVNDIKDRYLRSTPEERREVLMPFLWKVIAKQGQIFGSPDHNARAKITNSMKFSYPGYNEMFVGFSDDANIRSNDKNPNANVNVLEYLNREPHFVGRVAAYATWDVIPFVLNRERSGLFIHAGHGPIRDEPLSEEQVRINEWISDTVVVWNGNGLDSLMAHGAREHLRKHRPRVLFMGFGETDEWAHARRYDLYLDAAHKADRFLERLWNELQNDPQYRNNVSLVISTDHGRGETVANWTDHGEKIEGAEYVWMGILGPDTPALGIRRDVQVTQSQIAATLAAMVGKDFRTMQPRAAAPLPGVIRDGVKK